MSFLKEGRWTNALALKGDYYLIQFGHNNEPGKPGRSTDMSTFVSDTKKYVDDTRAIGAKPILVTPLTRRQWDKQQPGKIKSSLALYAEAVKQIGVEKNVPVIDLHARSIEVCEKLGKRGCLAFSPLKAMDGTNAVDNTHLTGEGHVIFGKVVAEELVKAVPELKPCFKPQNEWPSGKIDQ
jgi:pectinesterase